MLEKRDKQKLRSRLLKEGYLTDQDIKRIRAKLRLTQKTMAEKLGVGLKTLGMNSGMNSGDTILNS